MSIVALLISKLTPPGVLYQYINRSLKKDMKSDCNLIVSKAKSLKLNVGQKEKLNSDHGSWLVTKDDENLIYAACVSEEYPERVIFGLFQKMQVSIKQKNKGNQFSKIVTDLKKQFNILCQKYKDANLDRVIQVGFDVQEIEDEEEVSPRVKNQSPGNPNAPRQKTVFMKNNNTKKVIQKAQPETEKQTFWHKWKFFIMLGIIIGNVLIIGGILLYFNVH